MAVYNTSLFLQKRSRLIGGGLRCLNVAVGWDECAFEVLKVPYCQMLLMVLVIRYIPGYIILYSSILYDPRVCVVATCTVHCNGLRYMYNTIMEH